MYVVNGLPGGSTIEIAAINDSYTCPMGGPSVCAFPYPIPGVDCSLGSPATGEQSCASSFLRLDLVGTGIFTGYFRHLDIPIETQMNFDPRIPFDPVQSFDADLFRLFGQIVADPDFDLFRIVSGTDFGLPSPGHTTLVQNGGDWHVDSFFDITYRIDFVGAPGGVYSGMSGSTTLTVRLASPAGIGPGTCYNIPIVCDDNDPYTVDTCDTILGCVFTPVPCDDADPCTDDVLVLPGACLAPGNGAGTADLPAAVCSYMAQSPMYVVNGLPGGSPIEIAAINDSFTCPMGGPSVCAFPYPIPGVDCSEGTPATGEQSCASSFLRLDLVGTGIYLGWFRHLDIPIETQMHFAPRTPFDPVQSFDADLFRLFGQITGDPDFDLFRIVSGTDFGLPSPGHTTLFQNGGDWHVDSFFDITYRIDFVGAPGGVYSGMSGSTTLTVRLATPAGAGPPVCVHEPIVPCGSCTADLYIAYDQTTNYQDVVWAIHDQADDAVVASGGFNPGEGSVTTCVPDGCYYLRVTNSGGNVVSGGYRLVLDSLQGTSAYGNLRIIDNRGNLTLGAFASNGISNNEGFCIPLGGDEPLYTSCDRYWWKSGEYLVARENAAVSGLFGVTNATSGYEFWFYDPNGALNFRKLRTHAVSDGFAPNNALRACHIKLNNWAAANHLQEFQLYNVRIRGVVDGSAGEYGPACRVTLDPVLAACPPTGLNDIPANPNFSCGVDRIWGGPNQVANRLFCRPVAGANLYEWEFTNDPNEPAYYVTRQTTGVQRHLNWASPTPAMSVGNTYNVRVRASKNGGLTWCAWGWTCQVTIVPSAAPGNESMALEVDAASDLALWPNPNNGQQVWIALDEVSTATVAIDIFDLRGQRVMAREVPAQGDHLYTMLDLDGVAAGTYVVAVTAGEERHMQRLVVQP
ncbi:MAG: T9SS type A sorting domain-containing protein [Flavobacteriales bacterium]|nr:T9SS type A sorting domain-containing protein [Flavobacteriales bacterium]